MPYVAKFADGTYLVRVANARSTRNRRRRTGDLEEATTWSGPGHVKNALVHAAEEGVVERGEEIRIVEVMLEEKQIRDVVTVEGKPYSYHTRPAR